MSKEIFKVHKILKTSCARPEVFTLRHATSTATSEQEIREARPFDSIPTIPGGWLPILGHVPVLFRTKYGFGKSWMNFRDLRDKYAKDDNILRFNVPLYNKRNGKLVVLFESTEVEKIYRAEGKYPYR